MIVVAAGCTDDEPETLTTEEFQEQANKICADTQQELNELEPEFPEGTLADASQSERDALADVIEDGAAIVERRRQQLADIRPPEEDQQQFDEVLALLDEQREQIDSLVVAIREGDDGAANDLVGESGESSTKLAELASELGVEECTDL